MRVLNGHVKVRVAHNPDTPSKVVLTVMEDWGGVVKVQLNDKEVSELISDMQAIVRGYGPGR